jgi:hypothetical protein
MSSKSNNSFNNSTSTSKDIHCSNNNSSSNSFGDSLPPNHPYASYSITDQDIDDQIATINSLTISDQQHPMDILTVDT